MKNIKKFGDMFLGSPKLEGVSVDEIVDRLEDIREILQDISDKDVKIIYSAEVCQKVYSNYIRNGVYAPTGGDFASFAKSIASVIDYSKGFPPGSKSYVIVNATVHLPGESTSGNAVLNADSIMMLDDIVVAVKRLDEYGFGVQLDLNGNHRDFKPAVLKISFEV